MSDMNSKKRILYYLLADFREGCANNKGGTQFHVKDLTDGLKDQYIVYVLARNGEKLVLTMYSGSDTESYEYSIWQAPKTPVFYDTQMREIIEKILREFSIDMVHVHHTLWMTLDVFDVASELGIPVIFTAHDFYSICPILSMVDSDGCLCTSEVAHEKCSVCISNRYPEVDKDSYIDEWRMKYERALSKCAKIIVPSDFVSSVLHIYMPVIDYKVVVINHGILEAKTRKCDSPDSIADKEVVNVAFIGDLGSHKGSEIITDVILEADQSKYHWFLFGGIGDVKLYGLEQSNLIKYGWYDREEVIDLLLKNDIDVVGIISMIPETFSYTYSEAVEAGIPVFVTDVGALGERIRKDDIGWIVPKDIKATEIIDLLNFISNDSSEYMKKIYTLQKKRSKPINLMLEEYINIYNELLEISGVEANSRKSFWKRLFGKINNRQR